MKQDDHSELIQKYFHQKLSPEEQQLFNQLHNDAAFQQELKEFKHLRDLLEVGSLMKEAKALIAKIKSDSFPKDPDPEVPELIEPAGDGEPDLGQLGRTEPISIDERFRGKRPGSIHPQPPLQLRSSRMIRYAIAASVLLLLVVGLTFFLMNRPDSQEKITTTTPLPGQQGPITDTASLTSNAPLIASISYKEVTDNPVRVLPGSDTTFTVKIYPAEDNYNFHYLFSFSDDTLRLYGKFDPKNLKLQYNDSRGEYQLTYKDKNYLLERDRGIAPLVPAEE